MISKNGLFKKLNNLFIDDYEIQKAIDAIKNKSVVLQGLQQRLDGFIVKDGKLIFKPLNLEVIPKDQINNILTTEYTKDEVGGKGIVNFYKYIRSKYININRDEVRTFLQDRPEYQMTRTIMKRVSKPILSDYPNNLWGIDLIDLQAYKNQNYTNRYIITVVDIFSRKIWLGRTTVKKADKIAAVLDGICKRAGVYPDHLLSDNGGEFQGDFSTYCKENKIKQRFTMSYAPQSNGTVERANQEIRRLIRFLMIKNNSMRWMYWLPTVENNRNSTYNDTIKTTPNELWTVEKKEIKANTNVRHLPAVFLTDTEDYKKGERREIAQGNIKSIYERQQKKYKGNYNFEAGDEVRVKMSAIFSNVRRLVKEGNTKQIVISFSPKIFTVFRRYNPKKGVMGQPRYVVMNDEDELVGTHNKHQKMFLGSDLLKVGDNPVAATITMVDALKLNKVKRSKSDAVYQSSPEEDEGVEIEDDEEDEDDNEGE